MTTHQRYGIEGRPAPEFTLAQTLGADGKPTAAPLTLASLTGRHKLLYCFQSWCPGCHQSGFPTLAQIVSAFAERPCDLSAAVIQTVFEGFEENNFEALVKTRQRYNLPIPFAHDPGNGREGDGSQVMRAYHSGGTPWFILIGPDGRVLFNDFRVNAGGLIDLVRANGCGWEGNKAAR